jgi:hypothetical protein
VGKRVRLHQSAPPIPDDILALLGDPPVLSTEEPKTYWALLDRVTALIKPRNVIEWMWGQ